MITLKTEIGAAYSSHYPKVGGLCFTDSVVVKQSFVLCIKFSTENPLLQVAANR